MNELTNVAKKIKEAAEPQIGSAAANVLLNLIPYAGGAVAAVIGEYGSQQRTKRICEILAALNAALEGSHKKPEERLSKDQSVELVHDTIQTAADAASAPFP